MDKLIYERRREIKDGVLTTKLTFDDGSVKYITIDWSMIYVSDVPIEQLLSKLDDDESVLDQFQAFDTTDGQSYYLDYDLSEEISDELLYLASAYLRGLSDKSI